MKMVIVNGQKFKITSVPQLYCISFCLYFPSLLFPSPFPPGIALSVILFAHGILHLLSSVAAFSVHPSS